MRESNIAFAASLVAASVVAWLVTIQVAPQHAILCVMSLAASGVLLLGEVIDGL